MWFLWLLCVAHVFIAFFHDLCFSFVNLTTLVGGYDGVVVNSDVFGISSSEKIATVIRDIQITEKSMNLNLQKINIFENLYPTLF